MYYKYTLMGIRINMEKKLDLRVYKTYKALHEAFSELLKYKSFEELTVNELCDTALIRRATFYAHFADKYEYFNFYLSELREEFTTRVSKHTDLSDPGEYCKQMLKETFKFVRARKRILERMKNSTLLSFLYQSLQEQFARELEYIFISSYKKKITPELELKIYFYAGGLINALYWWLNNPNALDEDTIAEQIMRIAPLSDEVFD